MDLPRPLLSACLLLMLSSGTVFAAQTKVVPVDLSQMSPGARVPAVANNDYRLHCGACHFPFQPGLLPARSWEKLLNGLDAHFGDNAELAATELEVIKGYLLDNAADVVSSPLGDRLLGSLALSELPLRITDTALFHTAHHILEMVLTEEFKQKVPYSNCLACHPGADEGDYSEDETQVPGMVDWKKWHMQFQ